MIAKHENLTFGNNIKEHDEASMRILFTNSNGLDLRTDTHRLIGLLQNSKQNNINILLPSETSIHWKTTERPTYSVKPLPNTGKEQQ